MVDESSSESLDLQISSAASNEEGQTSQHYTHDVPGPSGSRQEPAVMNLEEPYVPDVIKRLKSGGHVSLIYFAVLFPLKVVERPIPKST